MKESNNHFEFHFQEKLPTFIHAEQNACSQFGACKGSSSTDVQIGQISSSSTLPFGNLAKS